MLDSWFMDVRDAVRLILRNPLFALTAVLSLAVGIGANSTIFTVVDALLLRAPAGVVEPGRLVDIGRTRNGLGFDNASYPNFLHLRARTTTLADVYAYRIEPQPLSLGGPSGAERIYGGLVSTNYFATLGVRPALGRLFIPDEDSPSRATAVASGAVRIAVLSHRFWTRRFERDPSVVGRALTLNGRSFVVIGVAPEGFQGTTILANDVWIPMTAAGDVMPRGASLLTSRASLWVVMGGRLKPGVALLRAQAEVQSIGEALEREFPLDNRELGLRAVPRSPVPGNGAPVAAFLSILMGIVALVLAIACVNLSGILLARAAARRREISVRIAIGAGRSRLVRHLLTETLVLFALGAAAGLALARAMTGALVALLPALPVPVALSLALDARVLMFTAAVAAGAAILCGLTPALHAAGGNVVAGLKAGGAATGRLRLRNAFVVAQIALTIVLAVGAALFVRALQHAAAIDPGFDPRGVEVATLDLSLAGYTDSTGPGFAERLIQRVRQVPGVSEAALSAVLPLGLDGLGLGDLTLPGEQRDVRRLDDVDWNVVSSHYFSTLRLPLVEGRDFDERDDSRAPRIAIVNLTAARRLWPAADAVGKTLVQWEGRPGDRSRAHPLIIVGVARDAKYRSLGEESRPFIYVPMSQQYIPRTAILTRTPAGRRAADIRALVAALDPNLPLVAQETLEEHAAIGLIPQRIAAAVSGSLGIVALLLAAIGVYGVSAYAVTARTREIGIRVAIGATLASVVGLVLKQGLVLAAAGVALGTAAAALSARLVSSLLFGVGPLDAPAFAGAAAVLCAVAAAASFLPARHAANVPATDALKAE